ncbi:uncharacterized protein [Amphiura filiformis]|uniref:uncharacterized protein n=1 Tax=Amphiura filiformis TaxID=82378 RepID=UPI003B228144
MIYYYLGSISSVEFDESSTSSPDILQLTECIIGQVNGNHGNSTTSWMNNAETCKEEDRAAFNRVVGDAPRAHIRLKARHRTKADKAASDESSDSSSSCKRDDLPPNIGGDKQQDDSLESEGSSGSVFFRPTLKTVKVISKESTNAKSDTMTQSDAGIASCTNGNDDSQSSHGNHGCHGSRKSGMSSSSQDTGDSGYVARKSNSKRSFAAHHPQNIAHTADINGETSISSSKPDIEHSIEKREQRKRRRHSQTADIDGETSTPSSNLVGSGCSSKPDVEHSTEKREQRKRRRHSQSADIDGETSTASSNLIRGGCNSKPDVGHSTEKREQRKRRRHSQSADIDGETSTASSNLIRSGCSSKPDVENSTEKREQRKRRRHSQSADIDGETSTTSSNLIRSGCSSKPDVGHSTEKREQRKRKWHSQTCVPAKKPALLELTLQTATLMAQTQQMEQQLELLRRETTMMYDSMLNIFISNTQLSVTKMK